MTATPTPTTTVKTTQPRKHVRHIEGATVRFCGDSGDGIQLTAQARPREDGKLPFSSGDDIAVQFSAHALRVLAQ